MLKVSIGGYKRKILKYGNKYEKRVRNEVRRNLTIGALCSIGHFYNESVNHILASFMSEFQYRDAIK